MPNAPAVAEPITLYERLTEPFDVTYNLNDFTYISGEQVISRLNSVFGPLAWNFTVVEHGLDAEADEMWVHGRLSVYAPEIGTWINREQFGSQKVKRYSQKGSAERAGRIIDIGFDKKGAATDCLKKCATLLGVGLYLTAKDEQQGSLRERPIKCQELDCNALLEVVRFRNGEVWEPVDLAIQGHDKFGVVLCMPHYREHSKATQQETAAETVAA